MNPPEPRAYPAGEPLPECGACHERSYSAHEGRCLNPDCRSHSACGGCGEAEADVILGGTGDRRLCLTCAIHAMLEAMP